MNYLEAFSPDYAIAREHFRTESLACGYDCTAYPIAQVIL